MSYQVLARKWRPKSFAELVGQDHVEQTLTNALASERIHHAYLFTGTRGVGKTTISRILTKSLNCERGMSATPCGQCPTCLDIDDGKFVDLLEIDAASRTRVEDTREILDNVQYRPTRGRYKVYLIDEVHMLSNSSFNALLKTLEEPPEHVVFFLATTDPQKIPATVLSRCLQFHLKSLTPEQIGVQLAKIAHAEQVDFEQEAVDRLAIAADGSMRDGLSLLDQAIAFGNGGLVLGDVLSMLGTIDFQYVEALLTRLSHNDAQGLMGTLSEVRLVASDFSMVLEELLNLLHDIAVYQVAQFVAPENTRVSVIKAFADTISSQDIQLFYQLALHGRKDLPLAPHPFQGLQMTLLRMLAFRPASETTHVKTTVKTIGTTQTASPAGVSSEAARGSRAEPVEKKQSSIEPPIEARGLVQEPSVMGGTAIADQASSMPSGLQSLKSQLSDRSAAHKHLSDGLSNSHLAPARAATSAPEQPMDADRLSKAMPVDDGVAFSDHESTLVDFSHYSDTAEPEIPQQEAQPVDYHGSKHSPNTASAGSYSDSDSNTDISNTDIGALASSFFGDGMAQTEPASDQPDRDKSRSRKADHRMQAASMSAAATVEPTNAGRTGVAYEEVMHAAPDTLPSDPVSRREDVEAASLFAGDDTAVSGVTALPDALSNEGNKINEIAGEASLFFEEQSGTVYQEASDDNVTAVADTKVQEKTQDALEPAQAVMAKAMAPSNAIPDSPESEPPESGSPDLLLAGQALSINALDNEAWIRLVSGLEFPGTLSQIALNSAVQAVEDNTVVLFVEQQVKHFCSRERLQKLEEQLKPYIAGEWTLGVHDGPSGQGDTAHVRAKKQHQAAFDKAVVALKADKNLQSLQMHFDVELNTDKIKLKQNEQ